MQNLTLKREKETLIQIACRFHKKNIQIIPDINNKEENNLCQLCQSIYIVFDTSGKNNKYKKAPSLR